MIDWCIPLKDKLLVELIRSVICWVSTIHSLGLRIIHLITLWCIARNVS
jgi:hypothetical protein